MSQATSRVSPRSVVAMSAPLEMEAMSLSQARWSEHRKKIGLSHTSFHSFHHDVSPQDVSHKMA